MNAPQEAADLPEITGHVLFAGSSLESLLERGISAFYGVVVEKSQESYEHITSPNDEFGWLYHIVTIEVLDCWQSPNNEWSTGDSVTYREFGGENERYRFAMEDSKHVDVGDYVVVIADPDSFLTPYRCFSVEDHVVSFPPDLRIQAEAGETWITQLPLEDFARIVKSFVPPIC